MVRISCSFYRVFDLKIWLANLGGRSIGANVTEDEYDMYLGQIDTFKTWFDATVMATNGSSHDAIMILPVGTDGPEYRDVSPE